jgi:hypothetical protein
MVYLKHFCSFFDILIFFYFYLSFSVYDSINFYKGLIMNKNMNPLQILQVIDVAMVFALIGFGYALYTTMS